MEMPEKYQSWQARLEEEFFKKQGQTPYFLYR